MHSCQQRRSSLDSVTLGGSNARLSVLLPVLDLTLPEGGELRENGSACGRTQGWSLGQPRFQEPLTCSNTTYSGIWSSAWRPLRCSRHSGASLEL